jgi:Flp pilus assembly protein TadD
MMMRLWHMQSVLAFLLMPVLVQAQNLSICGSLDNPYGPYDYRTQKGLLEIVERAHFTPEIENLGVGRKRLRVGADIDYTLRASPNHHRALMAMMNLGQAEGKDHPSRSTYSVACWFDRAERFAPDDAMVKVLHGVFLMRSGKKSEAVAKLEQAATLDQSNANIQYNLGLAYFDVANYEASLESAKRAYAAGFPLPGLRDKLKRVGKWRD